MTDKALSDVIEVVNDAINASRQSTATYVTIKEELLAVKDILQADNPPIEKALERLKELVDFIEKYAQKIDIKLP